MKSIFLILFCFTLSVGILSAQDIKHVPQKTHIYKKGEHVQWIKNGTIFTGTLVSIKKCDCDWKVIMDSDPAQKLISINYRDLRPITDIK